ncbi:ABC transporter ATP-binding protein [Bifidobacterium goeldii]|uniref:ABC transporter ATP-binding protein n=1 Tax=Bifidobacterium goeldii TaxID=2306975 RepID=A0A430FES2_9BIFI|nr:ATP-binding cassette domain-containing protein [Bifidobacterium goeldii]RSX51404.1 ABC transporter ATP-binding protein [Bifidobacterium goeldii]
MNKADDMTNTTDDLTEGTENAAENTAAQSADNDAATNLDDVQFSIIFDDDSDADGIADIADLSGDTVSEPEDEADKATEATQNDESSSADTAADSAANTAADDANGTTDADLDDENLDAAAANASRVNETLNLSVKAPASAAAGALADAAANPSAATADPALRLSSRIDKELRHDAADDILLKSYPTFALNKVSVANKKTGRNVLDRVDQAFYAGHMYAMLLPEGDAELHETLMGTMSGFIRPTEGNVMNKSANLTELEVGELRGHRLGLIPQQYALRDDLSAERNVIYAMDASGRTFLKPKPVLARELLQRVGFHPDTPNAPVSKLDLVDQRRAAIARAIACEAEVLIADEPTAGLNDDDSVAILQLLTSLTHGDVKRCVIILTESEAVANTAETIVEL